MYTYQGKFCQIEELTTRNDCKLFQIMSENGGEYERFVFNESVPKSYPKFLQKINEWFSHGRNYQFIVYDKNFNQTIGTLFFYNLNTISKTVKCSCFFIPRARKTILIIESLAFLFEFAKQVLNVECIKFSVYKENTRMHDIAKKSGAQEKNDNQNKSIINYEFSINTINHLLEKYKQRFTKLT